MNIKKTEKRTSCHRQSSHCEIQYRSVYRSFSLALQKNSTLLKFSNRNEMIQFMESSEKCIVAIEFVSAKARYRSVCNLVVVEDKTDLMSYRRYGYFVSPKTVLPKGLHEVLATSSVMELYEFSSQRYYQQWQQKCDQFRPDTTLMNWQMTVDCLYFLAFGFVVSVMLQLIELKFQWDWVC